MPAMIRRTCLTTLLVVAALNALGCIQRTITVNSDPEGALVWLNDEEVGRTPVTVPFTFYGTYSVRLEKDGFRTLNTETEAEMPWWELPGPDLIAEALPGTRRVDLQWDYELHRQQPAHPEKLLNRARELRETFNQPGQAPPPEDAADNTGDDAVNGDDAAKTGNADQDSGEQGDANQGDDQAGGATP